MEAAEFNSLHSKCKENLAPLSSGEEGRKKEVSERRGKICVASEQNKPQNVAKHLSDCRVAPEPNLPRSPSLPLPPLAPLCFLGTSLLSGARAWHPFYFFAAFLCLFRSVCFGLASYVARATSCRTKRAT